MGVITRTLHHGVIAPSVPKAKKAAAANRPQVEGEGSAGTNDELNVWDTRFVVVHSATLIEVGAVQCSRCQKVLLYNSVKTGTSSLNNHAKSSCPH